MADRATDVMASDGAPSFEERVELPADLDFASARALHSLLMDVVERPRVLMDARAVEKMSTAAALVIVSFLNAREGLTPPAAVEGPTANFVDTFSEIGLFSSLMRMEFRT